jgi:hypothetical protein
MTGPRCGPAVFIRFAISWSTDQCGVDRLPQFHQDDTRLRLRANPHFGLVARRDSLGAWRFKGHTETLPAAERDGVPRIFEADGTPLAIGKPAIP